MRWRRLHDGPSGCAVNPIPLPVLIVTIQIMITILAMMTLYIPLLTIIRMVRIHP